MNRATLSHLKSAIYRKPKEQLSRMSRWGLRAFLRCDTWAGEMERSVEKLPALSFPESGPALEVWFLTGNRFWYQTAYCAWTLAAQAQRDVVLHIVDDGTLTDREEVSLRRLFPGGTLLRSGSTEDRLSDLLPRQKFPTLRQRCDDYINIRKLVDVHLGSEGWKLVLDSDMLFFSSPDEMLDWWDSLASGNAEAPILLMKDCEESYGYSRDLMESLSGAAIPPLLNVGVCGLESHSLNWEELEFWSRELAAKEGTSYFLEQALVAMMASRLPHTVLPRTRYVTFPDRSATVEGRGVLQHYVADSKPWYFGHAWKRAHAAGMVNGLIALPA